VEIVVVDKPSGEDITQALMLHRNPSGLSSANVQPHAPWLIHIQLTNK
jgi:hypothetical protein